LQRQDLLEFAKIQLIARSALTDRSDAADRKRLNETQEMVSKLMFPENYTKTVLPSVELSNKVKKLDKLSKKFPVNYKKVNGRSRR
jgi:hypothetical protein